MASLTCEYRCRYRGMAANSHPKNTRSPRGLTLRESNERATKNRRREAARKLHSKLAQPQDRWQRSVRYVWDKKRG